VVIAVFIWDFYSYVNKPAADDQTESIITISPGQNISSISAKLYEAGITTDHLKFKLLARVKKYDKKIQAGEYLLSPSMPPDNILNILASGKVILHKITVPEGYNLRQVADIVEEAGLGKKEAFLTAAEDNALLRAMSIEAENLEGYLFPDTYRFPKEVSPQKIISTMVKRFDSVFTPEWEKRAGDLGFSVHQIVTLASIIEKETGDPAERPIISSVFHNRLKKKMRLESDPTVIYGTKDFDGNITRKHLAEKTIPLNRFKICILLKEGRQR